MKNKKLYIILGMFAIIFTFFGGTLSFLQWRTSSEQETEVVFTVEENFSCSADGVGNITNNDAILMPTSSCTNSDYAIQRTITVNPTLNSDKTNLTMDLWLDVNSIGSGLSNSENFRWALTTLPDNCNTQLINYGNFEGKQNGDKIMLLDDKVFAKTLTGTYYLYIWIDSDETSHDIINQTIDLSLNGNCTSIAKGEHFYAVYSADDTSLRFYKEDEGVITEGNTYNNITATKVYKMYENDDYMSNYVNDHPEWYDFNANITKIVVEDEISPRSIGNWFYFLQNVSSVDVTKLNTSNTVDMFATFMGTGYNSSELVITGLDNWNVSNVKNMASLFGYAGYNATTFNIGNLSNWNLSNVGTTKAMFQYVGKNATTFNIGNLSAWDVSRVTNHEFFDNDVQSKITSPNWVS